MDLNLFDNIDFDKAEDLFDSYINSCDIIKHEYVTPSNLVISTITVTGGIGTLVNDEIIYNCLKINDKIIYLEKGSRIRGNKPLKKKKRVKKCEEIRPVEGAYTGRHCEVLSFSANFVVIQILCFSQG